MFEIYIKLSKLLLYLPVILLCITSIPIFADIEKSDLKIVKSEFIFIEAPFEQCHASTIIGLQDGDLLVAWFGGRKEGDKSVQIWGSRYHASKWSKPEVLANEDSVPCWNPVLFWDPDDKIWLFYKFGPSPREWTGAYKISIDGAKNWSNTTYLPAGLLGPIKNKPIVLTNGDIVFGTSVESYKKWASWVEIISKEGATWKKYGPIKVDEKKYGIEETTGIIQPTMWEIEPGKLKMLVRSTRNIGFICQSISKDGGHNWSVAEPTTLPNPCSAIDAVKLNDGTIALVYNHTHEGRTPLNLAFSKDNGKTWSNPIVLESEPGEYSYPAIIQVESGDLHITYTWKRIRIKHLVISI